MSDQHESAKDQLAPSQSCDKSSQKKHSQGVGLDNLSVTHLSGVGPRIKEKLARIGIDSVRDLLFHLPYRYEDRTRVVAIGELQAGSKQLFEGEIQRANVVMAKKRMLVCQVADGSGLINLRFFHFNRQQITKLSQGARIRCFGEVRFGYTSQLETIHPEYTIISDSSAAVLAESLTPVYPLTEGLHQIKLRSLINQALNILLKNPCSMPESIPLELLPDYQLQDLKEALIFVHRPPASLSESELIKGRSLYIRRLAFDELLAHHLGLRLLRDRINRLQAPVFSRADELIQQLRDCLPFQLTGAQEKVIDEIGADFQRGIPMMRLLQGDVGSGKTLVAAIAALSAINAGYQVALMVPTEILAEQHLRNFTAWFEPLAIITCGLRSKMPAAQRRQTLQAIESGLSKMIVGTHALFQQEVNFEQLGLVIVDEQHRFGVHQRMALKEKGISGGGQVHQLIMTATPIPRTLAMTAYADLDVSVIDQLPAGRQSITTVAVPESRRSEVIERASAVCRKGQQAYWVCTLIEESESLQCQAAEDTAASLQQKLPDLTIGLVHGRMKPAEKQAVMQEFKHGNINLLVATTVIEVGVDVPNASLIIIENAERLGLAQLHQLRGRVGRGTLKSHCVLLYASPLGNLSSQRLAVMRESNDGFYISQKDLDIRGPGEVMGTRQTGNLYFKIADLSRDQDLLDDVSHCAEAIMRNWPDRVQSIIALWIHNQADYGSV